MRSKGTTKRCFCLEGLNDLEEGPIWETIKVGPYIDEISKESNAKYILVYGPDSRDRLLEVLVLRDADSLHYSSWYEVICPDEWNKWKKALIREHWSNQTQFYR